MRIKTAIVLGVILFGSILIGLIFKPMVTKAQVSDVENQKRIEHDKNVSAEEIEKARREATDIQNTIAAYVEKQFKNYKLHSRFFSDPNSQGIGRKGQTGIELNWDSKKTQINFNVTFFFSSAEALKRHKHGLERIAMGDFFRVPEFGEDAILVKNVLYNTINTGVGLYFVKGRASIGVRITNHQRKLAVNEKELIEFARSIEPLIVAKTNFDDF